MEGLFPLDGSRRLGGDVVDAAVDALDLVDNAVGNSGKKVVGESVPIGSHVVGGLHAADGSGLCVRRFNIVINIVKNNKNLLAHMYDHLP